MNLNTGKNILFAQIQGILAFFLISIGSGHAAITTENTSSSTVTATSTLNTITHVGAGARAEIQICGNLIPAIPAGSVDDILIATIAARDTGTNIATPAGWTQFGVSTYAGNALKSFLYYRIATGTDAVTFTTTGSCGSTGARVVRFSGVDTADPIEPLPIPYVTGDTNVTQSNSGNITTGTVTTTVATDMVVISTYINDNRDISEVGYSQSFDDKRNVNDDYGHGLFYQLQTTIDNKSVTGWDLSGGGSDENIDFIYALKPGTTTSAGSITVTVPAGLVVGDVMIATIAVTSTDTVTETLTSDWTLENRIDHTDTRSAQLILSRIVDGTEAGSYTWTLGANVTDATVGIVNYRGVDTSSAIDVLGGNETATSTSHTANAVVTTVANAMVVSAHSFTSSESWNPTPPSGMTEQINISSRTPSDSEGISLQMSDILQPTAGSTGSKTATVGGNADTGVAHLLALQPLIPPVPVVYYPMDGKHLGWSRIGGRQQWQ